MSYNATCLNSNGPFICTSNESHSVNGTYCSDNIECTNDAHIYHDNVACSNSNRSSICVCKEG